MKKRSIKIYQELFFTMFKLGAFTFGGGYAMISLLEDELISKKGWTDKNEFLNMIAISESTPGPISVNCATYVGYKMGGVLGSFFATLGLCLPSFFIIYVISLFFDQFLKIEYVGYAFNGIQACVIYLILNAGLKLLKELKMNFLNIVIVSVVLCAMVITSLCAVKFSSILYIIISGVIGLGAYLVKAKVNKGGKE